MLTAVTGIKWGDEGKGRCITSIEAGCDHIFKLSPSGKYRCLYCNQELPVQR